MADDEDAPWYRPLVAGVGALVGAAVLVGGVISLVALGALNVTGLGESDSGSRAEPSLYIPERTGTPADEEEPGLTLDDLNPDRAERESASPSPSGKPSQPPPGSGEKEAGKKRAEKTERKKREQRPVISLSASPLTVSSMQRIYLTGTYPGGEGASLQVQRFERGGWRNFPTSTSVSGGTFSTYVMTGQSGPNRFRVVDAGSARRSNAVTVRVR